MTISIDALTVDVEDWPQSTLDHSLPVTNRAVRSTMRMLDLFDEYGARGTFFVLGLVADRFPALVREIVARGHELGTHGYGHVEVFKLTPAEFETDIRRSLDVLQDAAGVEVVGYRAPDFSVVESSLWALPILRDAGLRYDSSIYPIRGTRYGIPTAPRQPYEVVDGLIELPLATVRLGGRNWPVAGGGYFRLFPYAVTSAALRRIHAEHGVGVVYLHPYEIDATELNEIGWPVPLKLQLTQGTSRGRVEAKLRRLLSELTFAPAREVLGL